MSESNLVFRSRFLTQPSSFTLLSFCFHCFTSFLRLSLNQKFILFWTSVVFKKMFFNKKIFFFRERSQSFFWKTCLNLRIRPLLLLLFVRVSSYSKLLWLVMSSISSPSCFNTFKRIWRFVHLSDLDIWIRKKVVFYLPVRSNSFIFVFAVVVVTRQRVRQDDKLFLCLQEFYSYYFFFLLLSLYLWPTS